GRNSIANNKPGGVLVSAGSGNTIRLNQIFANGAKHTGPGITLKTGANGNLAAPVISSATLVGSTLTVKGTFTAATANVNYVLDFYANPTGDAEGKFVLGSPLTVKPTSTGSNPCTFTTTTTVTGTNPIITATLTNASGSTSAFSLGIHDPVLSSLPASNPQTSVGPTSNSSPTAPASNSVPTMPPLQTPLEIALDMAALLLQGNAMALSELNSFAMMSLGHSLPS